MNAQVAQAEGVMLEVGGVEKPVATAAIVHRIREYLSAMKYARRPVSSVMVTRQQFGDLYKAATKNRDKDAPEVIGMKVDGVPLRVEGGN